MCHFADMYRIVITERLKPMKIIFATIVILAMSVPSFAAELKIGLIPEQNVFKQLRRYQPVGEYIESKTGHKIKFTILSRYGNIVESFYRKKLDGAFWGSFTGAMAIKKINIQPVARPMNLDGSSSYHGYIIVRKDSGIENVSDMKGKRISFVEKATTAGYIFPMAYFREKGVKNINKYFKEYFFAGSHDAAIVQVLDGHSDIACAKDTIYNMLAQENPRIKDELTVLARSAHVPSNGLGLRAELPLGVKGEIKDALLEMHRDPEGKVILNKFGAKQFIETSEKDYVPVFDIAAEAGINLRSYKYNNE